MKKARSPGPFEHHYDYNGRIFVAAGPFWPCVASYSTGWPSFRDLKPLIWISLWCAKRSLPPSSGVMNPKPFASLNHFTVPLLIFTSSIVSNRGEPDPGNGSPESRKGIDCHCDALDQREVGSTETS